MSRPASLTRRLTAFFTLGAVGLLLGLGVLFVRATDLHFLELDQASLHSKQHLVRKALDGAHDLAGLRQRLDALLDAEVGFAVALIDAQGALVYRSDPAFSPPPQVAAGHAMALHPGLGAPSFHVLQVALPAQGQLPALQLLIGLSTAEHERFMRELWWQVVLYMALAAALAGGLGYLAARQGLRPLRGLTERLQGVTAQQLHQELPEDPVAELQGLSRELNQMLRRLQADFARLSDFSADLAHELRTPLSNLLTQTQVVLSQPRASDDYREVLASNAEEIERLGRMVSDMLLLAKMEHGIELPHREQFALEPEIEALLEFHEAWAAERGLALACEGQATVRGDRLMLRRALSNLLSNALRHADPGSTVRVSLQAEDDRVRVSVCNSGPDIAPQDQARIFDRFYRADPARRHAHAEGAGLGLAITQAIARAHGGHVQLQSGQGQTCFSLQLPGLGENSRP